MITEERYKECASLLKCGVSNIKAVAEVEGRGRGFLSDGQVKILFEPHIFWKELKKRGINPNNYLEGNADILYPKWGTFPYGKESMQHKRLQRAVSINREAALSSASWGLFQILGSNWKVCGFDNIQEFINTMSKNEDEHLSAFTNYIINSYIDDELRDEEWDDFARSYNGPSYWKNNYAQKLRSAYIKYLKIK